MATIAELIANAARDLEEPFRPGDILAWFETHAPGTNPTSIRAHIQALTGNATNRLDNHPVLGARPAVLYRIDHGLYRRWRLDDHAQSGHRDGSNPSPRQEPSLPSMALNETAAVDEWFWEGNVQAKIIAWLASRGWSILRAADTRSREHGTDIIAARGGRTLHVEVKGWPSAKYVDPRRSDERKRTPPVLQARAWFADALLHGMRLRDAHPQDLVAIAMPDRATYRTLAASIATSLARADVMVLLLSETGGVTQMEPEGSPHQPGRSPV